MKTKEDGQKVGVKHMALMVRVNRSLAKEGKKVLKQRGMGYVVIDLRANVIAGEYESLTDVAEMAGVLRPWERLEI